MEEEFLEFLEDLTWEVDMESHLEFYRNIENVFPIIKKSFDVVKDRLTLLFNYISSNFLYFNSMELIREECEKIKIKLPNDYIKALFDYRNILSTLYSRIIMKQITPNGFTSAIPLIKRMGEDQITEIVEKLKEDDKLSIFVEDIAKETFIKKKKKKFVI